MTHLPGIWWFAAGCSLGVIGLALVLVGVHHEITHWLRQRRRRGLIDLTRRP